MQMLASNANRITKSVNPKKIEQMQIWIQNIWQGVQTLWNKRGYEGSNHQKGKKKKQKDVNLMKGITYI
jgi:hypothetical protein